ncbi:MAG: peptide chain release factor N(5)-glutamine methyltransferase [Flavobacteriaceae bacterium]
MTLIEQRNYYRMLLDRWYQQVEIDDIFKRCIQHYFGWTSIKVGLEPQYELSKEEETQLQHALDLLSQGTPLQYIIGTTTFMGLDLRVGPAVLIPRPETEELVEWILSNHPNTSLKVWDLCSGSGCVALGLKAQRDQWDIIGFELSEGANEMARSNATDHNLSVSFIQQDVLKWQESITQVGLIVSNPPYVLPSEKKQMHTNVLEYEPEMALFVPEEDPLLFYREILLMATKQLHPKGKLYFEINPSLLLEMIDLGKNHGFASATVKKDIFGKDRFIQFSKYDD